jgi:hypothetical protein
LKYELSLSARIYLYITHVIKYSAFTDKVERNCRFPAPGWNCIIHRQVLQSLPIRVKYRSIKTIKATYLFVAGPTGNREVTVAFNFISERTV